jgi:DNA modification methylase
MRKMGCSQQRISDQIGVPRTTISDWFDGNSVPSNLVKRHKNVGNPKAGIAVKPTFLSWCGKVEDFTPENKVGFDLIVADPPWNISTQTEIKRKARPRSVKKSFGMWDFFPTDDAYLSNARRWLQHLYELANTPAWCWFWCSYRYLSYIVTLAESSGWDVRNWFAWTKTNPAPLMGANNFLQAIEPILIMRKGIARFRFGDGHLPNFYLSPQVATTERIKDFNGNTINLAQKPVPLLSMIVIWCTDPGQWVLDALNRG